MSLENGDSAIKAIDKTSVHRICSGQVVLSLATAVKELVENAIDAGSTSVEIRLKEHGCEIIEVSDNGQGVHPNDFEGLTLKHHTSKLRDFSDLISVETFGFRGEALSSLCALCELSVVTRHRSQDCATSLIFDRNGQIKQKALCARQVGTSVTLANIFYSLPVRQKEFHKNVKREFNKMLQLLFAYCLVSSGVKISCTNQTKGNRNKVVATQGSASTKENIASVFGSKQAAGLIEIKMQPPPDDVLEELKLNYDDVGMFTLEGLVSSCAHGSGRAAPDRQFFFINSRPCDLPKVSKTVNEVYHQYNVHQYPFVFLNVSVKKSDVDVNVTPDKRQIFLNKEKLLLAVIRSSLLATYENIPSTFRISQVISSSVTHEVPSVQKPSLSTMMSQWRNKNDLKRPLEDNSEDVPKKKSFQLSTEKLTSFFTKKVSTQDKPLPSDSTSSDNHAGVEADNIACELLECHKTPETVDQIQLSEKVTQNESDGMEILTQEDNEGVKVENSTKLADESNGLVETETVEISLTQDDTKNIPSDSIRRMVVEVDETLPTSRKSVECVVNLDQIKNGLNAKKKEAEGEDVLTIKFRAAIDPKQNKDAEIELNKEISKEDFDKMEIIGQFNLGFIIAKLGSDLFIIDQHASDEKFNFETLQKITTIESQNLVVPQPLELTADCETILKHYLEVFTRNGFKFKFEENDNPTKRVFLTAVPLSKNCVFGKKDVDELLFMLQNNPSDTSLCRPSSVRAMFASRACRKSVMIGTALTRKGMKRIVSQMGTIEHPWNCPHGRPTMRHLINLDMVKR